MNIFSLGWEPPLPGYFEIRVKKIRNTREISQKWFNVKSNGLFGVSTNNVGNTLLSMSNKTPSFL